MSHVRRGRSGAAGRGGSATSNSYYNYRPHDHMVRYKKVLDERNTRVLIRERNVKVVLGPGGNNIKEIRSSCKESAQICIFTKNPDGDEFPRDAPDRIVNITADPADLPAVLRHLVPHVQMAAPEKMENKYKELRILVPDYVCSTVIGPKGENVQTIQKELGSYVQVYKDTLPNSSENVVCITNKDTELLVESVIRMSEKIKDIKSISHVSLYNPQLWLPGDYGDTGSYVEEMDADYFEPRAAPLSHAPPPLRNTTGNGRGAANHVRSDRYFSNRQYARSNGYDDAGNGYRGGRGGHPGPRTRYPPHPPSYHHPPQRSSYDNEAPRRPFNTRGRPYTNKCN